MENKNLELLSDNVKDYSVFFTEAHWTAFHLISALLDFIDIPDNLKHLNHRNIKRALTSDTVIQILGEDAQEIKTIYTSLLHYYSMGEYAYSFKITQKEFNDLKEKIKRLKTIIKNWIEFNDK